MKELADYLVGEHDFKSLSANKKMKKTTVRTIYGIDFEQDIDAVTIKIHVNDCWPYMMRKLVALLYDVGASRMEVMDAISIIEAQDPVLMTLMAEPQGLFLTEVLYK